MKLNESIFYLDFILVIALSVMHFVFSFFFKVSDFNDLFVNFESYPLFNFELKADCGTKDSIIFHTWEGWNKNDPHKDEKSNKKNILDRTNITKIYNYNFCYEKKASYKDLLYNDQIIKKGGTCKLGYKNCGTIDTLEQELCIKNDEQCPLYDVRLDSVDNIGEYHLVSDNGNNIYYNNDIYEENRQNKKIIGKLVLSDGIPCYNINEKLWRKFSKNEAADEHLKCDMDIFGKYNDARFEEVGKISYKDIYEDNLPTPNSKQLFSSINQNIKVSLYKREFLGIDKECDSEAHITREDYDKLVKSIKMEKAVLITEGIVIFLFLTIGIFVTVKAQAPECAVYFNIATAIITFFVCIICQGVAFGKIMYYSLSYDCSDNITNEIFRKENQNTRKQIEYTAINLFLDVFFILINILLILCEIYYDKCCKCDCDCCCTCCPCCTCCSCSCCSCCACCSCYPSCPCCNCLKKNQGETNNEPIEINNNYNNNICNYAYNANVKKGLGNYGENSVSKMVTRPYQQNQNIVYINQYNPYTPYMNYYNYPNNNTTLEVKIQNNIPNSKQNFN